jgi:putative phosphoesterase
VRLLLISDTHIPKRARTLPNEVLAQVNHADIVIHAGDWTDLATFDALDRHARRLIAVYGNNDGLELRQRLPEIARVELDGLRLAVMHDSGPAKGREQRCDRLFPDTDVLVFGHSHIPWDTTTANGLRLLNPGSPTDRRRQSACTYMTAEIQDAQLRNVTLHALPARS